MQKKSKILFIMQLPPPVHGASMMNFYVKNSKLIKSNYDTRTLELKFVKKIDEIGKASIKKFLLMIVFIFKLAKELIFHRPNLVYYTLSPSGGAFIRDSFFILIIKFFRVNLVYHLHGKGIDKNIKKSKLLKEIYILVFKNVHVIILSKRLYEDIELVYTKQPYILSNGIVEQKEVSRIKKRNDKIVFVFLSNLIIEKGIILFLEAIKIIYEKGYDFEVKIIGNDSENYTIEKIKTFFNKNNLMHLITDLGPKYGKEKYKALARSDILVFPTTFENETFGLVNLEAMQMGLAIISTNIGAIPDIIEHNQNGFILEKVTVKEVSKMMIKYLENNKLRMEHGKNNIAKVKEKYTIKVFEKKLNKIFSKILIENAKNKS